MKLFSKVIVTLLLVSYVFSSCGVIFGGSRFSGSIIAKNHPDAYIYVNGNSLGKGTAIQSFPRNRPLAVELREDGCAPVTKTYDNTFRTGNFIASLLFWGLLGVVVDLGTGASFKPDHKHNPAVLRMSDKNFVFTVDFDGCPVN